MVHEHHGVLSYKILSCIHEDRLSNSTIINSKNFFIIKYFMVSTLLQKRIFLLLFS